MARKTEIERLIERVDRGESIVSETDEIVEAEVTRPRATVIVPVRIPSDKWAQLREEANEIGVGPSTLLRMWILERLRRRKTRSA
jgi:hypothetical protein